MNYRELGRTGWRCSEVGLGCWQLGADWGQVSEPTARAILEAAWENGVNFFDTADVYGNGRSERIIGQFIRDKKDRVFVATKVGQDDSLFPDQYTQPAVARCVEGSLQRLGVNTLDLLQLHCVPTPVLERQELFEWLRELVRAGKVRHWGASVESMAQAQLCLRQQGLAALQIIFNVFRQKPADRLLPDAQRQGVAIIVRLPLASGLLAGKFTAKTTFAAHDHRHYNRDGQAFNVGETFAGLPFEKGVQLADALKPLAPSGMTPAQMAQRWTLDHQAVSVIIPGATRPEQARTNAAVSDLSPLPRELHQKLHAFYEQSVKQHIRGPY